MPFYQRIVQPVAIGRSADDVGDEAKDAGDLTAFSHMILLGLIKQLTSLAENADDLFRDLLLENEALIKRTEDLGARCIGLESQIKRLNHKTEKIRE